MAQERYIHLFDTVNECSTYEDGQTYVEPYVSLTEETREVHYNVVREPINEPINEPFS